MEKLFRIGEIADLLQIPTSKLRFWEQQGLLQLNRNDENNYRQYSFLDLLRITDVIFYRNLHFSTKELQQLFRLSAEELEKELEGKQTEIEQQLTALQKTKQEIQIRRNHLHEAVRLQQHPYQPGTPDFQRIRLFREEEQADWQQSLLDQYTSIGYQPDADSDMVYCLPAEDGEPYIWQKEKDQYYVEALLRFGAQAKKDSNTLEHCQHLQELGWQTGTIVSRYLFTALQDGIDYDYHKGWIAVEKIQ